MKISCSEVGGLCGEVKQRVGSDGGFELWVLFCGEGKGCGENSLGFGSLHHEHPTAPKVPLKISTSS